ncbi:hypothetical protein Pfo_014363 [Paulownia fortunei]|nr:hypothetical protein Pfo_014363 [Paulownia fortunei]
MLNKIFSNKKPNNLSMNPVHHARDVAIPSGPVERVSRVLKIIHAGGHAEYYYMAIPAARIIEKYPSFILTRPEVFLRPWDAIVRPEEILVPGQKYYVVPRQTVKKLRRRIRKTSAMDPGFSFESKSSVENTSQQKDGLSISGILVKPGPKVKARNLHVRFCGVETTNQKPGSGSVSVPSDKKSGNVEEKDSKERRARNENAWQPSLDAINE